MPSAERHSHRRFEYLTFVIPKYQFENRKVSIRVLRPSRQSIHVKFRSKRKLLLCKQANQVGQIRLRRIADDVTVAHVYLCPALLTVLKSERSKSELYVVSSCQPLMVQIDSRYYITMRYNL